MSIYLIEEVPKNVDTIRQYIAFGEKNLLEISPDSVGSLSVVASIIIVFALVVAVIVKKSIENFRQPKEKAFKQGSDEAPRSNEKTEKSKPLIKLEKIKGVGNRTATKLEAVNIAYVSDLIASSPTDLAHKTGISERRLSKWIELAKAMVN